MNKEQMKFLYSKHESLYDVYIAVQDSILQIPQRLKKHELKKNHTLADLVEYTKNFSEYELQKYSYEKSITDIKEHNKNIGIEFEEFCLEVIGFNDLSETLQIIAQNFLEYNSYYKNDFEKFNQLETIVEFINEVINEKK